MSRGLRSFVISGAIVALASWFLVPVADAYNGSNGASYADTWATGRNPNYPNYSNDCTNFVSQSLYAAGFPMTGYPNKNDQSWWVKAIDIGTGLFDKSPPWDNTQSLWNFLIIWSIYPGGYDQGSYAYSRYGDQMYTWANDRLSPGDVVFYDWDSNGTYDHNAFQTSYGHDSDPRYYSYYGSLVDAHTNDHWHSIWTLRPYNTGYYSTTTIDLVHVQ